MLYSKQPFRRGMDYAVVNSGMVLRVNEKNGNIENLRFCVGNIESKPCLLEKVSNVANGRYITAQKSSLFQEIVLDAIVAVSGYNVC